MIKYLTSFGASIKEVEIVRETIASVFLLRYNGDERKASKRTEYENYHDSWADAHQFLLDRAAAKVSAARRSLESASGELGNIKGMKEPVKSAESPPSAT